jgi:excisionase family DNA binding protein
MIPERDTSLLLSISSCSAIAELLADRLAKPNGKTYSQPPMWLSADEAAGHLRCPVSRIRKLTSTDDLPHYHDGRRVLYRVDELDEFVRRGGGKT